MKKKTAGRGFRRAATTAFVFVLISNASLEAVEPGTDNSELFAGDICEITQAALALPLFSDNDSVKTADLGLRPSIEAAVAPRFDEAIVGIASFYDYPQETASGETYDPKAFTAAAQLDLRERFGGIRFGKLYRPAYAIAEYGGKKLIIKLNDVGPLLPGRTFDLSRAAMEYFDGVDKGLLEGFKVTPLPLGPLYATGPVTDADLIALGFGQPPATLAQPLPSIAPPVLAQESAAAAAAAEPQPETVPASPYPIDDFVPAPIGDVADLSAVQDG